MDDPVPVAGLIGLVIIIALFAFQVRIGKLRTAAWLVSLGTLVLLEHPTFPILYVLRAVFPEGRQMVIIPHARIHFLMAGIYSLLALALILFIAWEGLLRGRRTAWYAILGALIIGGGSELLVGRFLYQHGSPIFALFGVEDPIGSGWDALYLYPISWAGALVVSFHSIFRSSNNGAA